MLLSSSFKARSLKLRFYYTSLAYILIRIRQLYKVKTCGATQNPEFPGPDWNGPKQVRGWGTFLRIFLESDRVGEFYVGSVRVGVFFIGV